MKSYQSFLLLFQVLMALAAQKKTVPVFTGTEGGSVDINCRYKDSYIYSKQYFCRAPCSNSDVLIETQKADIPVSKDRYSILNTVSTRSVSVTIKNLRLTDSGVYYCGVDQWGSDTLTKVEISVKKGKHEHKNMDNSSQKLPVTIITTHCTALLSSVGGNISLLWCTPDTHLSLWQEEY
uniref:Immunoglobulin domain-containing protein n=1 Tax=Astyanax mexicanus TaxID=7994 RepID=A0A3B1JLB9_ASTMX